jgi:hypothetical protein
MEDRIAEFPNMEEVRMGNIGIAVKSGSFLSIVYGNKLACQDNLGANNGD